MTPAGDAEGSCRLLETLLDLFESVRQLWSRVSNYALWQVVIEFALIWVVVYLAFRFLRGTRGAHVLKGVGIVILLATVAVSLLSGQEGDFDRLKYLYGNSLFFVAIALLIVFQPELRRALVRLGEAKIFRGPATPGASVIEELKRAVSYLARNKIGALIAIERETGLADWANTGTAMNANVTAELIETIFWPGSALHDMGVVVKGDRVLAAGVQFPLAEGDNVAQELGSRHRAALGLSQESDCLVIVVSEETGTISLAERGELIRKLTPETLQKMLERGLSINGNRQNVREMADTAFEEEKPAA